LHSYVNPLVSAPVLKEVKKKGWVKAPGYFTNGNGCQAKLAFRPRTVKWCQEKCLSFGQCNAINTHPTTGYCEIRMCKEPITIDSSHNQGYVGYKYVK